jgi:hypothetical protein
MTGLKPKGDNRYLILAATLVIVAAIAAGTYLYQKNREDQKTFTLQIGGKTISATVNGDK